MTIQQRLKEARLAAGLSRMETAYRLRNHLPPALWIGDETIRRIEQGDKRDDELDPVLITGLARVYGVKVAELSSALAKDGKVLADLLIAQLRCPAVSLLHFRIRRPNWFGTRRGFAYLVSVH